MAEKSYRTDGSTESIAKALQSALIDTVDCDTWPVRFQGGQGYIHTVAVDSEYREVVLYAYNQ